tara:strand:+ start:99 stop:272 length:174 start_codon:yes stop_codon:yes gene_type:complete
MKIFEKRGQWCFRDEKGLLHKFLTKAEAEKSLGISSHVPEIREYETIEDAVEGEDVD